MLFERKSDLLRPALLSAKTQLVKVTLPQTTLCRMPPSPTRHPASPLEGLHPRTPIPFPILPYILRALWSGARFPASPFRPWPEAPPHEATIGQPHQGAHPGMLADVIGSVQLVVRQQCEKKREHRWWVQGNGGWVPVWPHLIGSFLLISALDTAPLAQDESPALNCSTECGARGCSIHPAINSQHAWEVLQRLCSFALQSGLEVERRPLSPVLCAVVWTLLSCGILLALFFMGFTLRFRNNSMSLGSRPAPVQPRWSNEDRAVSRCGWTISMFMMQCLSLGFWLKRGGLPVFTHMPGEKPSEPQRPETRNQALSPPLLLYFFRNLIYRVTVQGLFIFVSQSGLSVSPDRIVKMSSPNLNILTLCGSVLTYSSGFLFAIEERSLLPETSPRTVIQTGWSLTFQCADTGVHKTTPAQITLRSMSQGTRSPSDVSHLQEELEARQVNLLAGFELKGSFVFRLGCVACLLMSLPHPLSHDASQGQACEGVDHHASIYLCHHPLQLGSLKLGSSWQHRPAGLTGGQTQNERGTDDPLQWSMWLPQLLQIAEPLLAVFLCAPTVFTVWLMGQSDCGSNPVLMAG
ncbi:hypothetical protein JZ751_029094 [Albula glossodonta]|uniref:Uncharacterized protein n=1 Tax=Albula glossodonta TaxID=121402 RepID=A0A8T2PIU1_9TELE|nr:hypothetical protein JZ751_029094 [Albula glossodonta]